jgi:hypothetical protein
MFALSSGVRLGLWSRDDVAPAVTAPPGSVELAITLADADAVRAAHCGLETAKAAVAQQPTALDFGYTFVAPDPDGTACASLPRAHREDVACDMRAAVSLSW